ncbi:MAG: hypothetical protein JXA90_10485 [Planctomycetes bacterium]|nr:hypothetical protein [Planctomycetota bacterium]
MSGIAGVLTAYAASETLDDMLDALRHRGRDGSWQTEIEGGALGVRAADLGPEKGPAHAVDGDAVLLFDGEIYNERPKGVADAQVALDLYREHGRLFAAHLQGAFACAVYDKGAIALARDPVGIRPVYWGTDALGSFAFASEAKALVGRVNEVHEVAPATVFSRETGVQSYLPVHPRVVVPDDVEEAKKALREVLLRATERRLADGAVGGVLLSGGLDSSIIAAVASELKPGLPAFTVGVEGAPDLEHAACMAKHLGLRHEVRLFEPSEIAGIIERAVETLESFDEDCVSGAIANIVASALASQETSAILSGEGGDELNGGYLLLKDLPDDEARRRTMQHLIDIAYNTALQRLDRAMFANSLNYRTPFLDSEVIAFCLQMPVTWKIHAEPDGRLVEKWLLREAFRDLLPESIYRRQKLRFSGGTGTDGSLEALAGQLVPEAALTEEMRRTPGGYRLNSPKELHYYRIFRRLFPEPCFESLVGRWDPQK